MMVPISLLILFVLLSPSPALAVQVHGGMEGLMVHLMGHFLFLGAICFILFYLSRRPLGRGRGWRLFCWSMILFLLWNLDTMANHLILAALEEQDVMLKGFFLRHYISSPLTPLKWAYYLTSFDHLLCVPAVALLALSMREFVKEGVDREPQDGEVLH